MKILFITNMFPTQKNRYFGIFVKEQIEYIQNNYNFESKLIVLEGTNWFSKYIIPRNILNTIKIFKPDIIHIHYGLTGLPILLAFPFIGKIKIVTTYHGSDINGSIFVKYISFLISSISTVNIAVSKEIFDKLKKFNSKTKHIPCGVDPLFLKNNKNIERRDKIIFSGHPNRKVKNYELFQKVVKILGNKYKKIVEVVLFDSKTRSEVKEALLSSKCLVMTSLSEGSPQVVKEAIVSNLPIVSTSVGDVPYLLKGLPNCYIAQTAEDIADKVNLVLSQSNQLFPDKRKRDLSNENICNKIVDLYYEFK